MHEIKHITITPEILKLIAPITGASVLVSSVKRPGTTLSPLCLLHHQAAWVR